MTATLIKVRLLLEGGHSETVELAPDSSELLALFRVLGQRRNLGSELDDTLMQIPLGGGREALSFSSAQLVAITTTPPVIPQFEITPAPASSALGSGAFDAQKITDAVRQSPSVVVIDDFLSSDEHDALLAFALENQSLFDAGTVAAGLQGARQNLAILDFAQQPHSKMVCNRLLSWFPALLQKLGINPFPVHFVESQITASNDGHFYRSHVDHDQAAGIERVLTCVYYVGKQPSQFSGGALRIYDALVGPGLHQQADEYQQVEPIPNRMVVFPSNSFHELLPVRCPSGRFEDSRFALTNWIWRSDDTDAEARHGWGHLRCGHVPVGWVSNQDPLS